MTYLLELVQHGQPAISNHATPQVRPCQPAQDPLRGSLQEEETRQADGHYPSLLMRRTFRKTQLGRPGLYNTRCSSWRTVVITFCSPCTRPLCNTAEVCVQGRPHLGGGAPTWRSSFGAKRCHRPKRFTSRSIPLRNGISPGRSTRRSANVMQVTNPMLVICSGGRHLFRRSTCNSLAGPKSPVPRHITPHSVTTTTTCAPGSSFQTQYHKSIPDARQASETWRTLNQRPCDMRSDKSRHSHLPVSLRMLSVGTLFRLGSLILIGL